MLSQEKRAGWVRIMFENFNSIGIGTQTWKMERLNHLVKDLKIDIVAGCETNLDWRQLPESMMDLYSHQAKLRMGRWLTTRPVTSSIGTNVEVQ